MKLKYIVDAIYICFYVVYSIGLHEYIQNCSIMSAAYSSNEYTNTNVLLYGCTLNENDNNPLWLLITRLHK